MSRPTDQELVAVQCPYCFETVEILLDESEGELIQDCEVCCNPWQVLIRRSRTGDVELTAQRLD